MDEKKFQARLVLESQRDHALALARLSESPQRARYWQEEAERLQRLIDAQAPAVPREDRG